MRVAVVLTLSLLAAPAHAGPAEDAEAANQDAQRRYNEGDREGALTRFRDAYALHPEARFLFNIATVLEDLGRPDEAADAYERHLADAAATSETIAFSRQRLDELLPTLGIVHVYTGSDEAHVTVDGRRVEGGDAIAVHVKPGEARQVVAALSGRTASRTVAVKAGDEVTVDLAAALAPPPPPPETRRVVTRRWYLDPWGDGLVGAGFVGLGVGVGLYVSSAGHLDAAASHMDDYAAWHAEVEEARTQRTAAQIALAAGVGLAAGGIVRWAIHGDEYGEVTVSLLPDGVYLCGRF